MNSNNITIGVFPSPVGVFLFIYIADFFNVDLDYRFRPLSGSFFLYFQQLHLSIHCLRCFRPLSGSFFLYKDTDMSSPDTSYGFRPLSGSFFLYLLPISSIYPVSVVSVPCRGLSFYIEPLQF